MQQMRQMHLIRRAGRSVRPMAIAAGFGLALAASAPAAAQELPSAEAIAAQVQEQVGLAGISVGATGGSFTVVSPEESGAALGEIGANGGTSVATGDDQGSIATGGGAFATDG